MVDPLARLCYEIADEIGGCPSGGSFFRIHRKRTAVRPYGSAYDLLNVPEEKASPDYNNLIDRVFLLTLRENGLEQTLQQWEASPACCRR